MAISMIKCRDIIGCRWHRGSWLIHNHHDGNLGLTLNLPASWMWSATPTDDEAGRPQLSKPEYPVKIYYDRNPKCWIKCVGSQTAGSTRGAACESLNRRLSQVNGKASTVTIIGPGHSTQTIVSGPRMIRLGPPGHSTAAALGVHNKPLSFRPFKLHMRMKRHRKTEKI